VKRVHTAALLGRLVAYGEADAVVTLLTEAEGKVSAMVRGARKAGRRLGGALEPFHTLEVSYDDRGGELVALREASLIRIRTGIVSRLDVLDAAGRALRWARHLFPARSAEPRAWAALLDGLDALDEPACNPPLELARFGMLLLADLGYAIDFEQCVRCGRPCPPERAACIDAARGGLVCSQCGGAPRVIDAATRAVARALLAGERVGASPEQAETLVHLAEDAMAVHAGYGGAG
jgi:DNA repair protein RecO (recombination protein O)